ncbi:MAG TPA: glycoside hydrolase family 3 N-terminal domain-containing protein [Thermoanaerobaculia bacterium]|nr:glycoside hydrolase family 3 N-terminal domain-containing protein [Thermoanaerobaculia bacterium]
MDSHLTLPRLDVTRERLDAVELVPFRAAIEAGVGSVMMGHLAVGDDTLATLSPKMIRLLRDDLGFEGLVITDSFEMGALIELFDPGEAAVRAIEAGEDQILFSADTDAAIAAVKAAVRGGRISEARIDESVERILAAKKRVGGVRVEEVARRAVTLVRDDDGLLPLREDVTAVVVTDMPEPNPLEDAVRALNAQRVITINADSEDVDIDGPIVLLLALRPISGAGRIALPKAAQKLAEKRVIAISFGSPYVLRPFRTAVCVYGIQPIMQRAAIQAIRGKVPFSGILPITL